MAVIDALVVTLGLDPTAFEKGRKQADDSLKKMRAGADTERKAWEANNKRVAESFRGVKNEVVGLAAAVLGTASIIDFSKTAMTTAANVGYLAKQLNISTEGLSTFEAAVRQMGGTTANADSTITSLAMSMEQFKLTGRSPLVGWFQKLGITDASLLEPRNMQRLLDTLHNRFKGMDPTEALFIGTQMGIDPNTMRLLMLQDDAYNKQMATAHGSAAITEKQAADMQKLQQQLAPLTGAWSRLGLTLLTKAAPALIIIANAFTNFAEQHPNEAMGALAGIMGLFALNTIKSVGAVINLGRALVGLGAGGAAAGAEGAAGAGAAGALGLGPIGIAAAGYAAFSLAGDTENLAAYKDVLANPKAATDEQLGRAAQHILTQMSQTARGPGSMPLFQRFAAQAAMIRAEIESRHRGGGGAAVGAPGASAGAGSSLSERNNNPGNVRNPVTGEYMRFASYEEGAAASRAQLLRDYRSHGLHTIYDLINDPKWGWSSEGAAGNSHASSMNYIGFVSRALGVGAHQQIDYTQPQVLSRLMQAMAQFESGHRSGGNRPISVVINEAKTPAATARAVTSGIVAQANRGLS